MLRSDLLTNWSSDLTPTQVFDFNSGETEKIFKLEAKIKKELS